MRPVHLLNTCLTYSNLKKGNTCVTYFKTTQLKTHQQVSFTLYMLFRGRLPRRMYL